MKRRSFIKNSALVGGSLASLYSIPMVEAETTDKNKIFNLDYAPHDGMFKNHAGNNFLDQIDFIYEQGFRSIEDNEMRGRSVDEQKKIGEKLKKYGIRMGVFVAHDIPWESSDLAKGDEAAHKSFLKNITDSVEVAKRCNAKWMTVVPGLLDRKLHIGYQTANIVTLLKKASTILEPHNLIMVLEPLNPFVNHPGLFLTTSPQAYAICKAVESPSCKILFDIYHQQITEGNIINNIEKCWKEIAYFQIGDNPGRKEPTTGELNYFNIFKYIYSKNYKGILGMEHGNSKKGKEGELAVIKAYRECDNFKS